MSTPPGAGQPRRLAWFHCFAGIAGDMALGSLVDAGADLRELERLLDRLPIGGWSLEFEPVLRNGIAATRAVVGVRGDSVVRTFPHILGILEEARLPDRVRDRAIAAFSLLATVEGGLHRRPASQVHFHEVGGHDTIVDIVGTASALELLGVDTVTASPVATGIGMVRSAHGMLPNPAPAVVRLLEGIPTIGRELSVELTTPTGAAMLAAWGSYYGAMPAMVVETSGFGAGTRELDELPNCTQVVVGLAYSDEAAADGADGARVSAAAGAGPGQPLVVLEANLDDVTGETLAHAVASLLDAGALDAWITPVVMKKGRPGQVVSVLCDPSNTTALRTMLARETGSIGVRAQRVERWAATRRPAEVEVEGLPVRLKVSPGRVKAEHDDAARVAAATGLPVREVAARAEQAWREQVGEEPGAAVPAPVGRSEAAEDGDGGGTGDGDGPMRPVTPLRP